jgi:hypothetical protein
MIFGGFAFSSSVYMPFSRNWFAFDIARFPGLSIAGTMMIGLGWAELAAKSVAKEGQSDMAYHASFW